MPGVLSVLALAGTGTFSLLGSAGVSTTAGWVGTLGPLFFVFSVVLLGRAHYLLYWRRRGNRLSKVVVWIATAITAVLWVYRFGLV